MREVLQRLRKIRWDDRKKLLASGGGALLLLLAALLLPLAFRDADASRAARESEQDAALRVLAKANLFVDYWNGNTAELSVKKLRSPGQQMTDFCEGVMRDLYRRSIDDRAIRDVTLSGSEYVQVSDGDTELRLCRMWRQSTGDWQNWMDVCFDADSGAIYYYYLSRECLSHSNLYELEEPDRPSVSSVADGLAAEMNYRLRDLRRSGTEGTAVLSTSAGTLAYEISCVYYDVLRDIRVLLV